jgi:YVTN family beta-propeller protein
MGRIRSRRAPRARRGSRHLPRAGRGALLALAIFGAGAVVAARADLDDGVPVASAIRSGASPFSAPTASPSPRTAAPVPAPTGHRSGPGAPRLALLVDPHDVYASDHAGDFSPAVRGVRPRVYVPNTLDGTISVIDPATFRVVKTIHVGGQPHHVTPSWDLRRLYVDNPRLGALEVVDPRRARLLRTIRVASPYNLYFTPDGTKALVVAEYDQEIEFRDRRTWHLLKRLHIPGSGVDHMDFSPNGRYLLVSDEYDGLVVRVSTTTMKVTGTVRVGGRPVDVKVSPDGRVFFVANQGLSGVSIIDPARMKQIGYIHTGAGAHGFAFSRDGTELYLSNRIAGTISVIPFATRTVAETWNVGGSPDMLQVSPNGRQLWPSNRFGNTVTVIGTRTGRVVKRIRVGRGPHGLCYFPEPGRYSIGHNGVYR